MFQKFNLRTKFIAIAVPPLVVLGLFAVYGLFLSTRSSTDELAHDIRTLGLIAVAAVLLTALALIVIGQTIQNPVKEATSAARELADRRLPSMLEALRDPSSDSFVQTPFTTDSEGELGDLIAALNDVQTAATDVAAEQQSLVRQSLSDLVVNMARRNQTLLDRQIEYIDRLESAEEDPDRLEELFGLDHLATRMRRNAESLLVLAGAETSRRRGGPVAIGDVLRVAMSEIEDYRHVRLAGIETAEIGAQGAVDLAHLLSELMENATQFSPPDTPVEVCGTRHPDGTYFITVTDHGIGMSPEQLEASNAILAAPPELGLSLSRSLGFIVIGRLAQRLEIEVELAHTANGGVTAIVAVPAAVLASDDSPLTQPALAAAEAPVAEQAPAEARPVEIAPEPAALDTPTRTPMTQAPTAPAPAPQVDLSEAAFPGATSADAWTPPAMPERGANPLGGGSSEPAAAPSYEAPSFDAPSFDAPPAPAPAPVPAPAPAAHDAGQAAPQSDALAKLLGLDPTSAAPTEPAPAPAAPAPIAAHADASEPIAFDPADLFSRPASAPPAEPAAPWEAPTFDPAAATEIAPVAAAEPAANLDAALPSADGFDADVSGLLAEQRTSSGLVKRDRSKSQAPVSEGRPVKASGRSPDEIRSMLARYRDGLKGRPLEGIAGAEAPGAAPSPAADTLPPAMQPIEGASPETTNPWGDPA